MIFRLSVMNHLWILLMSVAQSDVWGSADPGLEGPDSDTEDLGDDHSDLGTRF